MSCEEKKILNIAGRAQPDPEPAYELPETVEVSYPSKRSQAK